MTISAHKLEELFEREIPISKSLGIKVISLDRDHAKLKLPLKPNTNHKGTMFGGSLYAACAFACYGIFLSGLRHESIDTNDIVISHGEIQYIAPVNKEASITAGFASTTEREKFFRTLKSKGKARLKMRAQIHTGKTLCAEFSGQFVAVLQP